MANQIDRLLDDIRISCPGVLDDVIKTQLYLVLDELFKSTNVWSEEIDFTVTPGVTSYTITPTVSAFVNLVLAVVDDNRTAVNATMSIPGTIVLPVEPTSSYSLTAIVSLTVNPASIVSGIPLYPAWIMDRYFDIIRSGVLFSLFSQAAKSYSNEKLAILHGRLFSRGKTVVRVEVTRNNMYRAQAWTYPQAFARRKVR